MATESSRETGSSASNKHKNRFLNIFPCKLATLILNVYDIVVVFIR